MDVRDIEWFEDDQTLWLECKGGANIKKAKFPCDKVTENTVVNNMVPNDYFDFSALFKQTKTEFYLSMAYNYLLQFGEIATFGGNPCSSIITELLDLA